MLFSSKGRAATVFQISENSVSPGVAIVKRGYVEDANNGKQKIHIVARDYLYQRSDQSPVNCYNISGLFTILSKYGY